MRIPWLVVLAVASALLALPYPTTASHNQDLHSANLELLANSPNPGAITSDLAFWKKYAFVGDFEGFRIVDVSNAMKPVVLADVDCNGAQNDVSVWENLLFLSVDRPQDRPECEGSRNTPLNTPGFEGIRILDWTDPRAPRFVKGVPTDCGSHTHTLIPDLANERALLYVSSFPLTAFSEECPVVHAKFAIVEVPLARPQEARVIAQPSVAPSNGCHDIGVHLVRKIAVAACITEGQLWDISDPVNPVITHHIVNENVGIWHSGAFTWDGRVAIFGDEFGGGATSGGCVDPTTKDGRVWFYDPANPTTPLGSYKIPRPQGLDEVCTAHNYNVIPMEGRYVLVSAWYQGGVSVVDFTDLRIPHEIAFYDAQRPPDAALGLGVWSAYWYNGFIFASDIDRGLDVFRLHERDILRKAVRFQHLNPQTQEVLIG